MLLDTDLPAAERLARLEESAAWQPAGRLRHVGPASGLTALLRELAADVDGVRLHPAELGADLRVLTGQVLPALAADEWTRYVRTRAADGFNIVPHLLPSSLTDIVDTVVPELQERGSYRTAYEGTTLREHLALPPL
ncbi:hypothetical protein [Streptomyces sp. IBSBF 2435]|uniref:hypothetical protein n=1 Tax=Streptomyces sp. IBSBF 2435 TaxID=2903531 RepID=UPI003FA71339